MESLGNEQSDAFFRAGQAAGGLGRRLPPRDRRERRRRPLIGDTDASGGAMPFDKSGSAGSDGGGLPNRSGGDGGGGGVFVLPGSAAAGIPGAAPAIPSNVPSSANTPGYGNAGSGDGSAATFPGYAAQTPTNAVQPGNVGTTTPPTGGGGSTLPGSTIGLPIDGTRQDGGFDILPNLTAPPGGASANVSQTTGITSATFSNPSQDGTTFGGVVTGVAGVERTTGLVGTVVVTTFSALIAALLAPYAADAVKAIDRRIRKGHIRWTK